MSGLPGRYAGWMTRDLLFGRGIIMAGMVAIALPVVRKLEVLGTSEEASLAACVVVLDWTMVVLTLVATAGLVSQDFSIGHQRTLFAKPVNPPLYYLQRWLIGAPVSLVGGGVVAYAIGARFDIPILGPSLVVRMGLLYLVLGGLVFLLSTLTRRDWLLALALLGLQAVMAFARSLGSAHGPIATLIYVVLPPFHLLRLDRSGPEGLGLIYPIGYGATLVLAALAVLQWRPLARGARQ